jgi:hypothetical protein
MFVPSVALAQPPPPPLPRLGAPLSRVEGACGRFVVRLPIADVRDCSDTAPRGVLVDETFLVDRRIGLADQRFAVDVHEVAQTAEERRAAAAAFAAETGELPASSSHVHVFRRSGEPALFDVRLDDGMRLLVSSTWLQVRHYDVPNRPSAELARRVAETTAALAEVAARTFEPRPARGTGTRVTLTFPDATLAFDPPAGLYVRQVELIRYERMEEGSEIEQECATYQLFTPEQQPPASTTTCGEGSVCIRGCGSDAAPYEVRGRTAATDPRIARALDALTVDAGGTETECAWVVEDPSPPLNVRGGPAATTPVVGTVDNGTALALVERRGRWARIEAPVAGWVYTRSLRERCR